MSSLPPATKPRTRWSTVAILVMVVVFVSVVAQRDRIRAYWWVYRLQNSSVFSDQAYYVACLASVGDSAADALARLGKDDRAEYRALVIPASQGLGLIPRILVLRRRLGDSDLNIRISAATAISFLKPNVATHFLKESSRSEDPEVATAALSGLARVNTPEALAAICEAAVKNSHPWVRAQAVESLGQQLSGESPPPATSAPVEEVSCDPLLVLVSALADTGEFSERLSFETEIATVSRAVTASKGIPTTTATAQPSPTHRTVAQIAANTLSSLCGHAVQPRAKMSEEEKRPLVEQCRVWIAEKRSTAPSGEPQ